MVYSFNLKTFQAIQEEFSNTELFLENRVLGASRTWDYFFLRFKNPVKLEKSELNHEDLIDIIFVGDSELTKKYNHQCDDNLFFKTRILFKE